MRVGLEGKRTLVTGAASGIGRAIAEAYAREGATVAVHARSEARAAETLAAIADAGGKAFAAPADLTDPSAIEAMCKAAIERLGGIDVVVNNAGVADYKKVVDMDEAMWDWIMAVNLKAPYLISKHTLPTMIAQGAGGVQLFRPTPRPRMRSGPPTTPPSTAWSASCAVSPPRWASTTSG